MLIRLSLNSYMLTQDVTNTGVVFSMKILVTGAAGFIGFHTALRLLERGEQVVGLDNINDYYDPALKWARLDRLRKWPGFTFVQMDLADRQGIPLVFKDEQFNRVVHLGAQAGVRYSLKNPLAYVDSNLVGTTNVLEGCRHNDVEHLVYASTSSVYGNHTAMPFSPRHGADHPVSFYAATKKATELMAHTYSSLFGLPTTGLRFFTVYGPWGRPDMALFLFAKNILAGQPIDVFNHGRHKRDFTYIDDIVTGIVGTLDMPATSDPNWDAANPNPSSSSAAYRIYNIGNTRSVELMRYIELIEINLGKKAVKNFLPLQSGDVPETWADIGDLTDAIGYLPTTSVDVGIERFMAWYLDYYGAN
jgi:UDP-glucuronate 4-epimerase